MNLSSLLDPKLIRCGLSARTKEEALDEVVRLMAGGTPGLTARELRTALAEREKLGPFSMAQGGAFPHARTEKAATFRIAVGTAPSGIDFKAPDGNPVRVVVLFAVPKKHSDLYLRTLSQFLNLFSVREAARRIVQARTPEELVAVIGELSAGVPGEAAARPVPVVTGQTPLGRALEIMSSGRLEAVPVVDEEGNLVGEIAASALLRLEVPGASAPLEAALRTRADSPVGSLDLVATNGYQAIQEDEPLMEVAAKLSAAGARQAYVLRGRRLIGVVTAGEVLRKLAGGA